MLVTEVLVYMDAFRGMAKPAVDLTEGSGRIVERAKPRVSTGGIGEKELLRRGAQRLSTQRRWEPRAQGRIKLSDQESTSSQNPQPYAHRSWQMALMLQDLLVVDPGLLLSRQFSVSSTC